MLVTRDRKKKLGYRKIEAKMILICGMHSMAKRIMKDRSLIEYWIGWFRIEYWILKTEAIL